MKESINAISEYNNWIQAPLTQEFGELKRVIETFYQIKINQFDSQKKQDIATCLLSRYDKLSPHILDESLLSRLENTDAQDIQQGNDSWLENNMTERDWKGLKNAYINTNPMEMPIIAFIEESQIYHLLSGNTRLCVAKLLGIQNIKVLILPLKASDLV